MISRQMLVKIRTKLESLLPDLNKEFGVQIAVGSGGKYGETGELKLKISSIGEDGTAETAEVKDFRRYAVMFGLKPEDLYESFVSRGKVFKIVGLNSRAYKNPIIAESGGKQYVLSAESVVKLLATAKVKK